MTDGTGHEAARRRPGAETKGALPGYYFALHLASLFITLLGWIVLDSLPVVLIGLTLLAAAMAVERKARWSWTESAKHRGWLPAIAWGVAAALLMLGLIALLEGGLPGLT